MSQEKRVFFAPSTLLLTAYTAVLFVFLALPLFFVLHNIFYSPDGNFVAFKNIQSYFLSPGLAQSVQHSLFMASAVALSNSCLALLLAYILSHCCTFAKRACRFVLLSALFVPSFIPCIGLSYLLGKQGLFPLSAPYSLYGPIGIYLGLLCYTFPHALLLLESTLGQIDPQFYRAAKTLGASPWKRFFTITLPCSRYGLLCAFSVSFILSISDFGVPKVLGANYTMLATEIYVQVAGLHNFPLASVASLLLLLPALLAFYLERYSAKKVRHKYKGVHQVQPQLLRDSIANISIWSIALVMSSSLVLALGTAFIDFWPYNLEFTLDHFRFETANYGISSFVTSLELGFGVAFLGTFISFTANYLLLFYKKPAWLSQSYQVLALLPLAIPGSILGLAYLLCFKANNSFIASFGGGFFLLLINTLIHLYSVPHLNTRSSLLSQAPEYGLAAKTLGAGPLRLFTSILVPLHNKSLFSSFSYLFLGGIGSVSALMFLYTPEHVPAAVACLQLLDTGRSAEASALSCLLFATALGVHGLLHLALGRKAN